MAIVSRRSDDDAARAVVRGGLAGLALALILVAGCKAGAEGDDATVASDGCVEGMVRVNGVEGPFCVHAYEVHVTALDPTKEAKDLALEDPQQVALVSAPGLVPTKSTWFRADALCRAHGFHLCTSAEWEDACDGMAGPGGAVFPTPDGTYRQGQCNFTDVMGAPRQPLAPTGAYPDCHNPAGVYDMAGNLWEWSDPGVRDAEGLPEIDKRGGAHYGREAVGCAYRSVGSHPPSFEGTIGFRCCTPVREP